MYLSTTAVVLAELFKVTRRELMATGAAAAADDGEDLGVRVSAHPEAPRRLSVHGPAGNEMPWARGRRV